MKLNAFRQICLSALVTLAAASVSYAQLPVTVLPGYDLFTTTTSTYFQGVPYTGDPLGTFNFGSGPVNTGTTDTIVQRLKAVTLPALGSSGSTPVVMNALQLKSVGVVPQLFITLQPQVVSNGSMTITLKTITSPTTHGGTFNSAINVFYNVHSGSLTGPIVASGMIPLNSINCPWSNVAPAGTILIRGVNYLLNGVNNADDFFITGSCTEQHSGQAGEHSVINATCQQNGGASKPGSAVSTCVSQP